MNLLGGSVKFPAENPEGFIVNIDPEFDLQKFKESLNRLHRYGIGYKELAAIIGVAPGTTHKWFSGKRHTGEKILGRYYTTV